MFWSQGLFPNHQQKYLYFFFPLHLIAALLPFLPTIYLSQHQALLVLPVWLLVGRFLICCYFWLPSKLCMILIAVHRTVIILKPALILAEVAKNCCQGLRDLSSEFSPPSCQFCPSPGSQNICPAPNSHSHILASTGKREAAWSSPNARKDAERRRWCEDSRIRHYWLSN